MAVDMMPAPADGDLLRPEVFFRELGVSRETWRHYVKSRDLPAPPRNPAVAQRPEGKGGTPGSIFWTREYLERCRAALRRLRNWKASQGRSSLRRFAANRGANLEAIGRLTVKPARRGKRGTRPAVDGEGTAGGSGRPD